MQLDLELGNAKLMMIGEMRELAETSDAFYEHVLEQNKILMDNLRDLPAFTPPKENTAGRGLYRGMHG